MYVFDQSGVVDSAKLIEYISKEFPGEFKRLIEARDELAKRQGALSAVKDAVADREHTGRLYISKPFLPMRTINLPHLEPRGIISLILNSLNPLPLFSCSCAPPAS